ncbi:hypothetical protein [Pseudomonas phage D6]|nr:hypothetical protein [Pseudomonas phage D6]
MLDGGLPPYHKDVRVSQIDHKFFEEKKAIMEWSLFAFGKHWAALRTGLLESHWQRKEAKLKNWIKYNTSAMLYGRHVVGNYDREIMTGDNKLQYRVDAFYEKFDTAMKKIRTVRIRHGLRKP